MKKLLLGILALGAIAFAQDKVIDGVVYTEKVVDGKLIWVKKMVPKKTYVTVEKIIMVPAPVTSNRAQSRRTARRTVRRIENRDN